MSNALLKTDVVIQIGLLVNDIEKTTKEYASFFGVDVPPIYMTGEYRDAKTEYLGKPSEARARQSFFDVGNNIQIELIEPDKEPSIWRRDLEENGEGVHHIAFKIDGMSEAIELCAKEGMKLLQKGQWDTGSYAYIDSKDKLKLTLELLEFDN